MKVNLKIDDNLYEHYEASYGSPIHWERMKDAIEAYKDVPKGERSLLLHGDTRRAIEAIFQTTLDSPEKLLKLIKNLVQVKIYGVEVNFTADELVRLKMQAEFLGRTPEQFLQEQVEEIRLRMLNII